MKRLIYTVGLIGLVLLIAHCSDDSVEPPMPEPLTQEQLERADSISSAWFLTLSDTVQTLWNSNVDDLRDVRFDSMRSGFEQALGIESGNELGHLGLALIELLEINYSGDMWVFVDSLESWVEGDGVYIPFPPFPDFSTDRHRTVIGNQFQLMVEMPMITIARVAAAPDNISFDTVQDIIADDIIPKLSNAIGHMSAVEQHPTTEIRLCSDDEPIECLRFDIGEIKVFSAGLYALRSAMNSAIAYDVDFLGPDGSYSWVTDYLDAKYEYHSWGQFCWSYNLIERGAIDDVSLIAYNLDSKYAAIADSLLLRVMHHNFENRTDFLSLRNGGASLRNAHADMLMVFTKLEQAAAFIRDPDRDENEENVIKLGDLTDFDNDIQNEPYLPNFMSGWTRLEDVIAFGKAFLSGPYEFTEELGNSGTEYTWRMNINRMFLAPVDDWNSLLPYHEWDLPTGAWIQSGISWQYDYDNGGGSIWVYDLDDGCSYTELDNIGLVTETTIGYSFDSDFILVPLDGPNGNPIDPNTEFLYFPDYTFNGLFPDMTTHADWQNLYNILK